MWVAGPICVLYMGTCFGCWGHVCGHMPAFVVACVDDIIAVFFFSFYTISHLLFRFIMRIELVMVM